MIKSKAVAKPRKVSRITVEFRPKHASQADVAIFEGPKVMMFISSGALVVAQENSGYDRVWLACYAAGSWVKAKREDLR